MRTLLIRSVERACVGFSLPWGFMLTTCVHAGGTSYGVWLCLTRRVQVGEVAPAAIEDSSVSVSLVIRAAAAASTAQRCAPQPGAAPVAESAFLGL